MTSLFKEVDGIQNFCRLKGIIFSDRKDTL